MTATLDYSAPALANERTRRQRSVLRTDACLGTVHIGAPSVAMCAPRPVGIDASFGGGGGVGTTPGATPGCCCGSNEWRAPSGSNDMPGSSPGSPSKLRA